MESLQRTGRDAERKPELLLGQLAETSLYVEGGAGSGKSTFCRWVAYGVNAGDLPAREPAPPEGYAETFPEPLREHLPLLIRLRDFWTALPSAPGGRSLSRGELEQALHGWLDEKQPGQLSWACVGGHLQRGRLLIMLDGFDEVPIRVGADAAAYHPAGMLLEGLADAVPHWTGQGNRVLVTSRPYGLNAAEVRRLGLRSVAIADLDGPLQELLVGRWFDALSPDAEPGAQKAAEMRAHLAERAEVSPLVSSPMLLTALCVIFNQGKRLPRDKHELYDRILDNVLHNRYLDEQQEIPLVRNRLSVIAYGMHTGSGLDEDRETPQAEATTAEIERMIQRYRDESPATEPGFRGAVQACDDLLTRSGVLLPRPGKRAGFYHFTFQDFLAAQLILERESDLAAFFRRRAARQEWRSALSFVFTSLMSRSVLPDKGIRLLESLIEPLTLEALPLAVVVADCLEILAGRGVGLQDRHVEQFRQLCLDAIEREVPIQPRVELGLALGRLGDPRIVEDLRDHADPRAWVQVPAGQYTVGGGEAWYGHRAAQEAEVQGHRTVPHVPIPGDQFAVPDVPRRRRLPAARLVVRRRLAVAGAEQRQRAGVLAGREMERRQSAGGRRVVLGSGGVRAVGGRPAAQRVGVGSRRARPASVRLSVGKRLAGRHLQHQRTEPRKDDAGGAFPAFPFGSVGLGGSGWQCLGMVRRHRGRQARQQLLRWPCCAWRLLARFQPLCALRRPGLVPSRVPRPGLGFSVGFGFFSRTQVIR